MNDRMLRLDAILDELVEVERSLARGAARRARLLAEATAVRLAQAERGSEGLAMRSLVAEIGCATRVSEGTVARLVNEAEILVGSLPGTLEALSSGAISYRHAQVVARHAVSVPVGARAGFEAVVLHEAEVLTPSRFERVVRRERERVHPESIEERTVAAQAERSVRFEPDVDGMAWLVCHLPAVVAVAVDDRLDRLARAARSAGEGRTHGQLRADALGELLLGGGAGAGAGAGSDTGSGSGVGDGCDRIVPTVVLTVPALTLLGHDAGQARLEGYGPIDVPTARRLAARAPSFVRILTHPESGETVSVGRTRYRPPADLRLALELADEFCRFPGCARRASRCELDHTEDWAGGGETSRANLHHLCVRHHHVKHDSTGWRVAAGRDRILRWTSPTGRTYETRPSGSPASPWPRSAVRAPLPARSTPLDSCTRGPERRRRPVFRDESARDHLLVGSPGRSLTTGRPTTRGTSAPDPRLDEPPPF
ncbi:HNH endonuclease [Herbiconiux moechotypicola]|nr:HNH endonuclease signature motif containing protein [Herbiconiux moechotypicola]MCS5729096.1 HNH endonuclease [Herbiconiux moechotypicola]